MHDYVKYILTQFLECDELLAKNHLNSSPLVINSKSQCQHSHQKEEPNNKFRNVVSYGV
jgi:hypothetical protein